MIKLMIVEDEPIIREGLVEGFDWASLGIVVSSAHPNGKKALASLMSEPVDILLTDIRMPIMDGVALMREVSQRYPQTRIVVLSGYGEFAYAQEAIRCGALGYILKPTSDAEIAKMMEKVIESLGPRAPEPIAEIEDPVIARLKDYVAQHYAERISLEQLSAIAHMNATYVSTFFKAKTGCNFKEYHAQVRIERAKELLRTSDRTVVEIASMVGYDDDRYFARVFRAATGRSVSAYRKEERARR